MPGKTVYFYTTDAANYLTGTLIAVGGGNSIFLNCYLELVYFRL